MKDSQAVIVIAIVIFLGILAFVFFKKEPVVEDQNQNPPIVKVESIIGCYIAGTDKDLFTLNVETQMGENVGGKMSFKNFEKDSSSGTFTGTYKDGILLTNYSFRSEGMDSVMQVIFKKVGNDFVRGYGSADSQSGTQFTDLTKITYDTSSNLAVFKKGACM